MNPEQGPSAEEMGLETDEETGAGVMKVGEKRIEMTPPEKTEEEKAAAESEAKAKGEEDKRKMQERIETGLNSPQP